MIESIPVQLSDGTTILVQAECAEVEREVSSFIGENRFEPVLASVIALCKDFSAAIKQASPEKAKLEFGIAFRVETTGLVALLGKGTADTNVRVTLEWGKSSNSSVD